MNRSQTGPLSRCAEPAAAGFPFSGGSHLASMALLFLLCGAACSSGPVKGEVQGKVTFKGQPVKEGTVTFLNTKDGGAAEAAINPDGTYVVQGGAVAGDYD